MRAGLGFIGLLLGVGLLLYIWSENASTVHTASKPAMRQAERLAGVDSEGKRVPDSITLVPVMSGSKLLGVKVHDIDANGPMATYFGLQLEDQILGTEELDFRGEDFRVAEAMVLDARRLERRLKVRRGAQEFKLPLPPGAPAPAPAQQASTDTGAQEPQTQAESAAAEQTDNQPPQRRRDTRSALSRQLDALPGVRRNDD